LAALELLNKGIDMAVADKDLLSIQEARESVERAYEAQKIWGTATQQQVDQVCAAMVQAAFLGAERLGRMAADETGFGVPEHKKLKNEFASQHLWNRIQDIKTVGFVRKDEANKIYEIAWPMGVVGALIPSTNKDWLMESLFRMLTETSIMSFC